MVFSPIEISPEGLQVMVGTFQGVVLLVLTLKEVLILVTPNRMVVVMVPNLMVVVKVVTPN